jgi:hypothetical protein
MYKKFLVLFSVAMLACFVSFKPASAQIVCDPLDPLADCDNDGIPNGQDTCDNLNPLADCDNDGIPNSQDTCDNLNPNLDCDNDGIPNGVDTCNNLDPLADCDGDGVANGVDQCQGTIVGGDLTIGLCTLPGFGDTILPTGCSLAESIADTLNDCSTPPAALKPNNGHGHGGSGGGPNGGGPGVGGPNNHGKFVSCVAHATNALKKLKVITGQQKGEIQSCAAQSSTP